VPPICQKHLPETSPGRQRGAGSSLFFMSQKLNGSVAQPMDDSASCNAALTAAWPYGCWRFWGAKFERWKKLIIIIIIIIIIHG